MSRRFSPLNVLLLAFVPAAAYGFADARISEVMAGLGTGGNATVQYVEIEMRSAGQNDVAGTRLGFFGYQDGVCNGSDPLKNSFFSASAELLATNVANGNAGGHWLMATAGFAAAAGITPDFVIDAGMTAPPRYPCGMVCWGKPTTASQANEYADCIAYGGYLGTTSNATIPAFSGMPTPLPPGDGTMSLTRVHDTGNNATDFALMPPTPTNNAGQIGFAATTTTSPGATTTSTTTAGEGTTTTTIPSGVGATVAGTHIVLKTPKSASNASFVAVLKDASIGLGDPTADGGNLRLFTTAFDRTYPLEAGRWKTIRKGGVVKGYRYTNPVGPIRLVLVKDGKMVKVNGHGAQLGLSLATDPAPVNVLLAAGGQRDCATFPSGKFVAGKRWISGGAPRPPACP